MQNHQSIHFSSFENIEVTWPDEDPVLKTGSTLKQGVGGSSPSASA